MKPNNEKPYVEPPAAVKQSSLNVIILQNRQMQIHRYCVKKAECPGISGRQSNKFTVVNMGTRE